MARPVDLKDLAVNGLNGEVVTIRSASDPGWSVVLVKVFANGRWQELELFSHVTPEQVKPGDTFIVRFGR